jgi:hypothetical protein
MLSVNYQCESRNTECNARLLSIALLNQFLTTIYIILYVCTYYKVYCLEIICFIFALSLLNKLLTTSAKISMWQRINI